MTVSPSLAYESAIFLDEATIVVETDLHALIHDLADRDQILCYCGHVVVKIPGHRWKQGETRRNTGVHECKPLVNYIV